MTSYCLFGLLKVNSISSLYLETPIESDLSNNILLKSPWSFDPLPSTYVAEYISTKYILFFNTSKSFHINLWLLFQVGTAYTKDHYWIVMQDNVIRAIRLNIHSKCWSSIGVKQSEITIPMHHTNLSQLSTRAGHNSGAKVIWHPLLPRDDWSLAVGNRTW